MSNSQYKHFLSSLNIISVTETSFSCRMKLVNTEWPSILARTNMSTLEATRPPPKPELKQKPRIPSKPGANTSHTPLADKDMLNKNSGKVHEIVSKFNHHDDQPPAAGPAAETGCQKKPKPPPTVKPKPNVRSPPQVRAEQAPPLPLKRRQSQRKDAEQNVSCDFTDGRRSGRALTHAHTHTEYIDLYTNQS